MTDIIVRVAESDNDVIAIHGFLCVVAGPTLPSNMNPKKSIEEIWRVVNRECALVVVNASENKLIGTIGLIKVQFWWGDGEFLANRWCHALPIHNAGKLMLDEAAHIAEDAGLECHIYDEAKGRLVILNKSPLRKQFNPFLVPPEHLADALHPTRH